MIMTFDIGGTAIKYGLIRLEGNKPVIIYQQEIDSNAKILKGKGIIKKVIELVQQEIQKEDIEGIAISTAGMVDAEKGSIIYANENIPEYTGMQVKEIIERQFDIPCWVENDVNAAALGETIFGAGKSAHNVFMLTIGTGIGGAVVLNHEIFHGSSGSAGEIGYMWIGEHHYQDISSTTALVDNVAKQTKEQGLNGKIIFERAKNNDEICIKAIDDLCSNIVKGISNCICMLNPQTIILGGGIMMQRDYLEPIMKKYVNKYVNEALLETFNLEFASLGNHAGMIGAFAYWLKKEGRNFV